MRFSFPLQCLPPPPEPAAFTCPLSSPCRFPLGVNRAIPLPGNSALISSSPNFRFGHLFICLVVEKMSENKYSIFIIIIQVDLNSAIGLVVTGVEVNTGDFKINFDFVFS